MEIVLKFRLPGSKFATDTRNGFWREYRRQAELPFEDDDYPESDPEHRWSPDRFEAMVRNRFVPRLNDALAFRFSGRRGDGPGSMAVAGEASPPLSGIVLTLSRIEYNSLDLVLRVLGLDDAALLPLLCGALEVYAAEAFEEVMPGDRVNLTTSAEFDRSQAIQNPNPVAPPVSRPNAVPGVREIASGRLWGILNGSLILPVVLALAVLYQMAQSVARDQVELARERGLLAQERNAILQSLVRHNEALNRTLSDRDGSRPAAAEGTAAD